MTQSNQLLYTNEQAGMQSLHAECVLCVILYSVDCFVVGEVVCISLFTSVRCSILYKLQYFLAVKFLPFVFLISLDIASPILSPTLDL